MIAFHEVDASPTPSASIKLMGVGGAGGNTVNSIINSGAHGIECIVANTDAQALSLSKAQHTIHIGVKSTKGLGTGANPDLGKRAAQEDLDKIMQAVGDADIVFLTAGMGGGTGSGALPVVAKALRDRGILSIAIVTKPFTFEGKRRAAVAQKALDEVRKEVDTLIVMPNQKLLEVVDQQVSMIDAFSMINDVLSKSVKGISDIITKPGHINVDFADVRTIMKDMGLAVMGTGTASGPHRAQEATMQAISSPLLENMSVKGARGVLLNITGSKTLSLHEISQAANVIYEQAHEDATIILGSVIDETLGDQVTVTIIATGFTELNNKTTCELPNIATPEPKMIACVLDVAQNQESVYKETVHAQTAGDKTLNVAHETLEKQSHEVARETQVSQNCASSAQTDKQTNVEPNTVCDKTETSIIDMHDLDVPTFLRKNKEHMQS